jgi:hypothetical protein
MFRIKMKYHSCDFAPVRTFRIRVEQAQISDEVLLIVRGQYGTGGRNSGDVWIKRWPLHGRSRNRLLIDQLYFGLLGILMTRTGEVRFAPMNGRRQLEPSGQKSASGRHAQLTEYFYSTGRDPRCRLRLSSENRHSISTHRASTPSSQTPTRPVAPGAKVCAGYWRGGCVTYLTHTDRVG